MKKRMQQVVDPDSGRYLANAREILRKSSIEWDRYRDIKHVQEACAMAYLAVLRAIDESLLGKGLNKRELPKSVDGYRRMLAERLSAREGKLAKEFEKLYDELHIAGYYRGLISDVNALKEIFRSAEAFIRKIK